VNSESIDTSTPEASEPKAKSNAAKTAKKAKSQKKQRGAKKAPAKAKSDRTNKKANVVTMMKRPKGASLPEIMKETGWQAHTVRGFVVFSAKTARRLNRPKNDSGERTYKIAK
jgi:hypothetical protein